MGGQQFGEAGMLVDTRDLNRVLAFDAELATITVEGGIQWPQLLDHLNRVQEGAEPAVGDLSEADRRRPLSIGGALSCNAHGRGLKLKPIVQQVEAFDLVDAAANVRRCSRDPASRSVPARDRRLRVVRHHHARAPAAAAARQGRRVVMLGETATIMDRFEERIRDGFLYGDYQFATDSTRDSFLRRGVFSCYQPVPDDTPLTEHPTRFNPEDWARLTFYSHTYKRRAFELYSSRYLETSARSTGPTRSSRPPTWTTITPISTARSSARAKGDRDDHRDLRPAPHLAAFMEDARGALGSAPRQRRSTARSG